MVRFLVCAGLCQCLIHSALSARRHIKQQESKNQVQSGGLNEEQLWNELAALKEPQSMLDKTMDGLKAGWSDNDGAQSFTSPFIDSIPDTMFAVVGLNFPILGMIGGFVHGATGESPSSSTSQGELATKIIDQAKLLFTNGIYDLKRETVRNILWDKADRMIDLEYASNFTNSIEGLLGDLTDDRSEVFGSCNQGSSTACTDWKTKAGGAATLLYEVMYVEMVVSLAAHGEKEAKAKNLASNYFAYQRTSVVNDMVADLNTHYNDYRNFRKESSNYDAPRYFSSSPIFCPGQSGSGAVCQKITWRAGRDKYLGQSVMGVEGCTKTRDKVEYCHIQQEKYGLRKCSTVQSEARTVIADWDTCLGNYQWSTDYQIRAQFGKRIDNLKCC